MGRPRLDVFLFIQYVSKVKPRTIMAKGNNGFVAQVKMEVNKAAIDT